jgi:YHS domain-containing protein
MKLSVLVKSVTLASSLVLSSLSFAVDVGVNADANDLAISGYDTVAYFTKGSPVKGKGKFSATYKGAIYHFATAENRDLFKSDPEHYAPQYGGYCAMGVALSQKFDVDPKAWRIVDNKLYLNLNKDVQKKWATDIPGHLSESERNWNGIEAVSAKVLSDE